MTSKAIAMFSVIALLGASVGMTGAYAVSDWRSTCGINNPIDNLECAVDTIESEVNSALALISALDLRVTSNENSQTTQDTKINELEARILDLESNSGAFIPSIYNVPVSTWTVTKDGGSFQTTNPGELFECNSGDVQLDLVTFKEETFTNSIGNVIETQFIFSPEYVVQRTNVDGQLNQHWFMMGDLSLNNGISTEQMYLRCLDITP